MFKFPYVSIDVETTGTNIDKSHVLQLAAVYDDGSHVESLSTFNVPSDKLGSLFLFHKGSRNCVATIQGIEGFFIVLRMGPLEVFLFFIPIHNLSRTSGNDTTNDHVTLLTRGTSSNCS